jgi:hypothetical protein
MQTEAPSIERSEFPAMLATLCSYECHFGPRHPQTLLLMAHVAIAYWQDGQIDFALPLLQRSVQDIARTLGRDHELRLRAIAALRDLLLSRNDHRQACVLQRELLECQIQRLGCDHPETIATRASLAEILMESAA